MESLKLFKLEGNHLKSMEMDFLKGGAAEDKCCCGCIYAGTPGGSSSSDNGSANTKGGLVSPGCVNLPEVVITK